MSNQTPDEFAQIGSDEEVDAALKPKKTAKGGKAEAAPKSNVVNIMDALRKSVEADLKGKKAG